MASAAACGRRVARAAADLPRGDALRRRLDARLPGTPWRRHAVASIAACGRRVARAAADLARGLARRGDCFLRALADAEDGVAALQAVAAPRMDQPEDSARPLRPGALLLPFGARPGRGPLLPLRGSTVLQRVE
eukprot:CAMPEP_0197872220 /NCGR_PEP_ID=MMETSP1439-20131203/2386_1 /TAXON_ID=66791 /ORGANISM="Gonyaulax spinifera, Strain CCMP409" /LENGTH=133 /DNA_ID=CAMNT_0043491195 /DNA_START=247 /DNA_END=648 /DNA_ORIENTATION=+